MVLKRVHQFVAEHVVGLLVGHGHREHHAVAQALRHAARAHADTAHDGVGLLKTSMVVVDDERIFLLERVL